MFIRSLANALDRTRVALRFTTIVQRRMNLADEASAPARVPDELMQDAYAQAVTETAPTNDSFVRREARPIPKLLRGQRTKPAG
jgi:hypothetical protein